MFMLNEIKELIENSYNDAILSKKWDIRHNGDQFRDFLDRSYPIGCRYYFEANPSFLFEYQNLVDMERYPVVMLRDGVIPIASFFLRFPIPPKGFSTKLLVHKGLKALVPKAWSDLVALYEFEFKTRNLQEDPPKKVLVYGFPCEYSFIRQSPKEVFSNLREKISTKSNVEFYLPMRERVFFLDRDNSEYVKECLKWLGYCFGAETKVHSDGSKLLNIKLTKDDAICPLVEDGFLIKDNYIPHWFSHKGVSVVQDSKSKDEEELLTYRLSPAHKIHIRPLGKDCGKAISILMILARLDGIKGNTENSDFHDFVIKHVKSGELPL